MAGSKLQKKIFNYAYGIGASVVSFDLLYVGF